MRWSKFAREDGTPLPFRTVYYPLSGPDGAVLSDRMAMIPPMSTPDSIIIIDTPSHNPEHICAISALSDFVILPCPASPVDHALTRETLPLVSAPHAVLMTRVIQKTKLEQKLRRLFTRNDVFVFPTAINHLEFFAAACNTAPTGDLRGYERVARELDEVLELLRESAAWRREQEAWEKRAGASLFRGLNARVHSPTYQDLPRPSGNERGAHNPSDPHDWMGTS